MGKNIFVLIALFSFSKLAAQDFGAYPSAKRWKQINSDTARIIFSGNATSEAQRISTIIHRMEKEAPASIGSHLKKVNIVLHSNTALANGYVGLAPFRSEYYLIPGSNIFEFGNQPWYEQLAVHEYRHVQQYNNFNNGISKALHYLLGQQGQALGNALSVPDWFFEGDAVYAETAFTEGGRGRTPYFWNGYKSLWLEGKKYSWMKLRNGSYKDRIPNHYYLGYLLANYGYIKYGPLFWQQVTKDASAFKGLIYPMQHAVKKYAGISYKEFRDNAFQFYKQQIPVRKQPENPKQKTITNIYQPQIISKDSLVYLKNGYDKIDAFYVKDTKGEHRIAQKMIGAEDWFSYRNGEIVYTAYDVNNRYSLQDYNDIIVLNIASKKEERITKGGKYFSPDISPDGKNIAAVSITDSLKSEVQILDKEKGTLIQKIPSTNEFIFQTRYVDNDHLIYGARNNEEKVSLHLLDLQTGVETTIIPPTGHTVGFPFVSNKVIYFTASFSGNDELYGYRMGDKKLYQISNDQTGNYSPAVLEDKLVFTHFTATGYQLKETTINPILWTPINTMTLQETMSPFPVAGRYPDILQTATRNFSVTPYKKGTGIINVHSYSPDYEDPNFTFRVLSDNILNTLSSEVYYRYNKNEQSHTGGFTASYGGLFPILNAGVDYTANRHIKTLSRQLIYNQMEAKGGYSIPLNFTYGKTYKFLNFGSNIVWNRLMPQGNYKDSAATREVTYLHHFISWRQQLPKAVQQIYPKLGYAVSLEHRQQIQKKGYQFLGNAAVYLPSFLKNHSLVLKGSLQQTDTANVVFANRFPNASGYRDYYLSKMWQGAAHYHFPIAYPDWGFGNILYFLRIRSDLFYNYTQVYSKDRAKTRQLRSTGMELLFDTKWWNQLEIPIGIRYSWLLDKELTGPTKKGHWELVIPINLIPN